jgi:protein gp37
MNRQEAPFGIEWTRIKRLDALGQLEELNGYTWNPTGGCKHGCTWQMPDGSTTECYAKTQAERFMGRGSFYTKGFEEHYWRPHMLEQPLNLKKPAGIFVGSMADLFGHWVPKEQIEQVIDVMRRANWHTFQTLSKYPSRLDEFNPFPDNVWVGVSLPAGHMMSETGAARALKAYLGHMQNVNAKVRFMSIEPLWFDAATVLQEFLVNEGKFPFDWVIIGAASNGKLTFQPNEEHFSRLLTLMEYAKIPVFFKGNLSREMAERHGGWRDEFPIITTSPVANPPKAVSPKSQQLSMFGDS